MRIKHSFYESYYLYFVLPCKSDLFNDVKRWIFYKSYASKQGAIRAMNRLKKSNKFYPNEYDLIFKIVWFPFPFASEEKQMIVYSDI